MNLVRQELPKVTDRYSLGSRGLAVSPICIGMVTDPMTVPAAFEAGINFFFLSADMHWPLYESTRRGLKMLIEGNPSAREQIVVAACSYVAHPEFLWAPFEEVVGAMPELGHLDVSLAGGVHGGELATRIATFETHVRDTFLGIRAIGGTFHDRKELLDAIKASRLDAAFVRYNPAHLRARKEVFDHIREQPRNGRPWLFNFKSTSGRIRSEEDYASLGVAPNLWRPHVTDYYRFALSEPALDGILCAVPGQSGVRDLVDALAKGPLSVERQDYMIKLAELAKGTVEIAPPRSSTRASTHTRKAKRTS